MKKIIPFLFFLPSLLFAQNTVGVLQNDIESVNGYTLFSPRTSQTPRYTYLIDNCGEIVNQWESSFPLFSTDYLMEDGSLYRSVVDNQSTLDLPGNTGRIEHLDWDGNLIWGLTFSDTDFSFHHDYVVLPNNNIIMLVAFRMTEAEAIAEGRDPSTIANGELYEERVLEIEPVGVDSFNIIWEWHSWDHLIQDFDPSQNNFGVVADHPELVNINYGTNFGEGDWWHSNALSYSIERDQILISNRNLDEFIIIDHSTTTAEAATSSGGNSGMGGDIIYRWGNPESYDQGTAADKKLFAQHDVQFIPDGSPDAGKIMIFNNGDEVGFTRVQIIDTPYDAVNQNYIYTGGAYGPETVDFEYQDPVDPTNFFAPFLSGAQQLANGNLLICNGPFGFMFEVDTNANTVWQYQSPVSNTGILADGEDPGNFQTRMFRALRYTPDYPGLDGRDLTPTGPIELNPVSDGCNLLATDDLAMTNSFEIYPNPVQHSLNIVAHTTDYTVSIYNNLGSLLSEHRNPLELNVSELPASIYFMVITTADQKVTKKFIKQ